MSQPLTTPMPLALPVDAAEWHPFLQNRVHEALAGAEKLIARIIDGESRTAADVLGIWNDADILIHNADAIASLLSEVHPDESVRTIAEELSQRIARLITDRGLNRPLFDVVAAVVGSPDAAELDGPHRRALDRILRDFRRSGVDADEPTRSRLRAISERSTVVEQDYSRNVRDGVRSIRVEPSALDGMPQDFIDDHRPGHDGLVRITTDYPDLVPFRKFSRDAAARRALSIENLQRAHPENDLLLGELLELRAEQAALLGYSGWPDYDAEEKMVGTGAAIAEFIDRVDRASATAADRDYAALLDRRRVDVPDAESVDAADASYYGELLRQENFDLDSQTLRPYFDAGRVREGLLAVTGRLFGLEYRPAADAAPWHPDVLAYDVFAATADQAAQEDRLGRIYLDLHPREGKYKHAAQFDLVPGILDRQLPEGVLVCNFPRGLMEHTDVVTLFHEFGHLVHHILGGRQSIAQFSGVATEWDFVEAPSQMLEEWAWDAAVLQTFAVDAANEPIPTTLVERMRAANEFGNGVWARTQLFYSAVSYRLHEDRPTDRGAAVRALQDRYDAYASIPGGHLASSFGHLIGYSSAYYTYLWSLVIAKDLFSEFDAGDLFDGAIAARYRDSILAPGGSADAADLVRDFLGRDYSFDAFQHWLESSPAVR